MSKFNNALRTLTGMWARVVDGQQLSDDDKVAARVILRELEDEGVDGRTLDRWIERLHLKDESNQ